MSVVTLTLALVHQPAMKTTTEEDTWGHTNRTRIFIIAGKIKHTLQSNREYTKHSKLNITEKHLK